VKVNERGLILALKNLGVWLASWTASGIRADPWQFLLALAIYSLVSVPSDLYLMNRWEKPRGAT